MIRPEQKTHIIKAYMTKARKTVLIGEAKKRGIGVSELIKVALFEYLSPTKVPKRRGIVRIDRSPKGFKDYKEQLHINSYRGVMVELKQYFAKKRREK